MVLRATMALLSTAKRFGLILIAIGVSTAVVQAADSYCFKFTWVGPEYDNETISNIENKTCEDLKVSAPCYEPLVVTYDATPPNTSYMWEYYDRDMISCKLSRNTVCLKWINYYDGIVENITYTCGKMTGARGERVRDACETWKRGAYTTRACACRTPGISGDPREPCNAAPRPARAGSTSLLVALLFATVALLGGGPAHCLAPRSAARAQ